MAEVVTKEELQQEIQNEIKELLVESAQIVKQYVDEHSIDNPEKREELKTEIADYIAQKYDFEAEKEKLEKASEVAEALLKVFDEDNDGGLDAKEILDKLAAVTENTQKIEDIEKEISGISETIENIRNLIGDRLAELKGYVDAVKADLAKTDATVKEVEARLNTQYFTKEEVKVALTINKDDIIVDVRKVFFPESNSVNASAQETTPANGANTNTQETTPANGTSTNTPGTQTTNESTEPNTSANSDGGIA